MEYKLNMRRKQKSNPPSKELGHGRHLWQGIHYALCTSVCLGGDWMLMDFLSKSRPNKKAASLNWPLVYRTNNIHTLITASTAVGTIIWMSDISNSWISYSRKTLSKQFYNAGCCTTVSHVFTELKTLKFEEHMIKTENRFICKCLFYSASLQNKIKGICAFQQTLVFALQTTSQ